MIQGKKRETKLLKLFLPGLVNWSVNTNVSIPYVLFAFFKVKTYLGDPSITYKLPLDGWRVFQTI